MRLVGMSVALLMVLAVASGCNTLSRQPRIEEAAVTPAQLQPGDTAIITVVVKDKYGLVRKVEGIVAESPRQKFVLRDDGTPPDELAEDGVWTLQVDVPFTAPPGEFNLEFSGYDGDGDVLVVRTKEGDAPLTGTCRVTVVYPEEAAQEAAPPEPEEAGAE